MFFDVRYLYILNQICQPLNFATEIQRGKAAKIQKSNIKMENCNKEFRSQKSEYRIPSPLQIRETMNNTNNTNKVKRLFIFLLKPKTRDLKPNSVILIFNF